jgi:hypothetical protein
VIWVLLGKEGEKSRAHREPVLNFIALVIIIAR